MQDGNGPDGVASDDVIAAAEEVVIAVEVSLPDDADAPQTDEDVVVGENGDGAVLPVEGTAEELPGDVEDTSDVEDTTDEAPPTADEAPATTTEEPGRQETAGSADDSEPRSDDEGSAGRPTDQEPEQDAPSGPDHLAFAAEAERVLDAVDRALARLRTGAYGTCEICNDAIVDTDLEVDPTAERCSRHLPLADSA